MNTKDAELMNIGADEQFMKNYQALYYAMNAKPDSRSKLFQKEVMITLQDLKILNKRVTEKFKAHYDDAGFRINISISFKNKACLEFDSWTTFEHFDFSVEPSVASIMIVWEYNAKLPGFPLPQRHTLTVRLADEIRAEEMLNLVISGKLEEVDKIEQNFCPIVARVDFINSILGDELLRIVEQWQDVLPTSIHEGAIYKKAKKYKRIIAYIFNYLPTLVFAVCSVQFLYNRLININAEYIHDLLLSDVSSLFIILVVGILLCGFVYKLFELIANHIFIMLCQNKDAHIFQITNGDKVLCMELDKKAHSKKIKLIGEFIFTFVFNIICSVLANLIT